MTSDFTTIKIKTIKLEFLNWARENTYRMEVCAEIVVNSTFPPSKSSPICFERKGHMVNLSIDLAQATYFFIQLFYQTKQKYSCTKTKLGKLLSIAAFYYARKGQQLFNEVIYKYNGCGSTIKELSSIVDRDIYIQYTYDDAIKDITVDEIDESVEIPLKFTQTDRLPYDVKNTLRTVFIKFGAYNAVELGNALNYIVQYPGVSDANGVIDLNIINQLSVKAMSLSESCDKKLVDFLFVDVEKPNA